MEILSKMASCLDDTLEAKFEQAVDRLQRTCAIYGPEHIAMSFNGGKDSTVLLHILRAAVCRHGSETGKQGSTKCFMFFQPHDFREIRDFAQSTDARYNLETDYLEGPFKDGMETYIAQKNIKAVVLGTRRGDPNAPGQGFFCPSSDGWPAFMRVNPILDWSYQDVWLFLRYIEVPYCHLYDLGYTSIGSTNNTYPNNALRKEDGTFAPAYLLADSRLERSGRAMLSREPSDAAGHTRSAAIIAIGDELLSGKIEDTNTNFISRELRSIGWRVKKIVFVGDNVDMIAEEIAALSAKCDLVVTSGGVGPTLDDVTMEGVARAMFTTLERHPVLEARLRDYFGENITEAHLKMAEVPAGIEITDMPNGKPGTGEPSPFPLIQCGNVYILPGMPQHFREKWNILKEQLLDGESLPPYHNVVVRLNLFDETKIAHILDDIADEVGVDVEVGSYPVSNQDDGTGILICLESKDKIQLDAAHSLLKAKLPEGSVVREQRQVRSWIHVKGSSPRLDTLGLCRSKTNGNV